MPFINIPFPAFFTKNELFAFFSHTTGNPIEQYSNNFALPAKLFSFFGLDGEKSIPHVA